MYTLYLYIYIYIIIHIDIIYMLTRLIMYHITICMIHINCVMIILYTTYNVDYYNR